MCSLKRNSIDNNFSISLLEVIAITTAVLSRFEKRKKREGEEGFFYEQLCSINKSK